GGEGLLGGEGRDGGPGRRRVQQHRHRGAAEVGDGRSGRPSPLTSPTATELGALPVAKVCWGRKAALASGLDRTTPKVRFDWRIVLPMTGTAIVAVAWLGANRKVPLVAV